MSDGTCVCGDIDIDPGGCKIVGLLLHRTDGPCHLIELKEPQLGCATTEEMMRELITRFEVSAAGEVRDDFDESVNYLRAQTLWNILYGMNTETKAYRTIDH